MGCLKGEGQSQGSELSSASLAAMTKAQRTHHPQGLSCWHRAELSKDTLVNTLPWPRKHQKGAEKNHYLQTDIPPCPWTPGPAQARHLQPLSLVCLLSQKTLWLQRRIAATSRKGSTPTSQKTSALGF